MAKINKSTKITVFIVILTFLQLICTAQTKPIETKENIQQLTLFKNGLGFFNSTVTCPKKTSSFYITPDATFSYGTFWVAYNDDIKLKSITRYLLKRMRENLFQEDNILYPIALEIVNDEDIWQKMKGVCDDIGYCGLHV